MVRLCLAFCLLAGCAGGAPPDQPVVATFSIVAYDPETKELGIAVESKFLAVGAVVPWAKAGVGAIATQSFANTTYGPRGLEMLAQGQSPEDVLKKLTESDERASRRQVGIVDAHGKSATFTGDACIPWCGGVKGENYCCQGNILTGEDVVKAMEKSFVESKGDLGERLIAALQAGQDAGGDRRGMQSAALLIVREGWGYSGMNDRFRDVRVDDHAEPIQELRRIYDLHRRTFPKPRN